MKPRVLNVVTDFRPFELGEQSALIAPQLADECEVEFYSLRSNGWDGVAETLSNFPTQRHQLIDRNRALGIWRLARLLQRPFDVVHAWGHSTWWFTCLAASFARTRPRQILLQSDYDWFRPAIRWPDAALFRVLKHVGGIGYFGQAQKGFHTINLCSGDTDDRPIPPLRSRLGIPDRYFLIGAVCPLEARSGIKHLIWALDLLKVLRDDVRMVLCGEGSQLSNLQKYAEHIAVNEWIYWLDPDEFFRSDIQQLDIYWQAERMNIPSPALLAALDSQVPAIAPRSTEMLRLFSDLADSDALRLIEWGARDELARDSLLYLRQWTQPRISRESMKKSQSTLPSRYRPANVAAQLSKIYRSPP